MTFRTISLFGITILAATILVLHIYATEYFLYWRVWWVDICMHTLGGIIIGLLALWFYSFIFPDSFRQKYPVLLFLIMVIIVVGIGWEIFEYVERFRIAQPDDYLIDTICDMGTNIAGSLISYLLFTKTRNG